MENNKKAVEVLRKHFTFEECEGCFGCNWKISIVKDKVQFECLSCGNIYRFKEIELKIKEGVKL